MKARHLTFLVGLAVLLANFHPVLASDLWMHFIPVGHGDAVLIEADHQAIALVDAGSPESASAVLNYLKNRGFSRIEHLFITHSHDDHVGGVPTILDSLRVGTVHLTGMPEDRDAKTHLDRYLQSGKWIVDTVDCGEAPVQSENLKIEVLSPPRAETAGQPVSPNLHSLVLLVTHGQVKVLLPANIDAGREKWLVTKYGEKLRSQAMKASHHASPYGNCEELLQTVKPQIVVVTVGPGEWGYPSEETIACLEMCCPDVSRTDEVGAVILHSDGRTIVRLKPE